MNDAELIKNLGGPTALAKRLKYKKPGSVQRVANWITRGIPARIKLEHPELFRRKQPKTRKESVAAQPAPAA